MHWHFTGDVDGIISLSVDDQRLTRYLKGETLNIEPAEAAHTKGWHLLCVEGYPLGFASWLARPSKTNILQAESNLSVLQDFVLHIKEAPVARPLISVIYLMS